MSDQTSTTTDPAAALTAPGAPFEMIEQDVDGVPCRVFRQSPQCLTDLYRGLDQHSEKTFVVHGDRRLSYAEIVQQAAALAHHLQKAHGIGPQSRVALAVGNRPEWVVGFLAVTALGGVPALVNSRGTADEIRYCISSTGCELVLAGERCAKTLDSEPADDPPRVLMNALDNDAVDTLANIIAEHDGASLPSTRSETDLPALILYTSGTTGRPKGALLTHRGVCTALMTNQYSSAMIGVQMAARYGIDLATLAANRPRPAVLMVFPLFHVSGCHSGLLANLMQGGKIVLMPRWDAREALALIEREKVTSFPSVPTMMWDLLQVPDGENFDTSTLSSLSVGGQATPLTLLEAVKNRFPQAVIGTGYGMTETNGVVAFVVGDDFLARPTCAGLPVATNEVRIRGEDGQWLETGQAGEICVRGATVMQGYANQQEANEKAFHDGWLLTGDVGYVAEDGYVYIVDRLTDMVISAGENIYCAEVERVLLQHPAVSTAVTFGVPDDRLGEALIAAVVTRPGESVTEDELTGFVREQIAAYKAPRGWMLTEDPLPMNATGKVIKRQVREMYLQNRDA